MSELGDPGQAGALDPRGPNKFAPTTKAPPPMEAKEAHASHGHGGPAAFVDTQQGEENTMSETTNENEVPVEVRAQLHAAVDTALSSPTQAQGFLGLPTPDLGALGEYKGKAVEILDKVLAAINTVQSYSWLLGSYSDEVQKLEDALTKVRGWLD